jgi:hypothetical protein
MFTVYSKVDTTNGRALFPGTMPGGTTESRQAGR